MAHRSPPLCLFYVHCPFRDAPSVLCVFVCPLVMHNHVAPKALRRGDHEQPLGATGGLVIVRGVTLVTTDRTGSRSSYPALVHPHMSEGKFVARVP